jgi:hypothetical protein
VFNKNAEGLIVPITCERRLLYAVPIADFLQYGKIIHKSKSQLWHKLLIIRSLVTAYLLVSIPCNQKKLIMYTESQNQASQIENQFPNLSLSEEDIAYDGEVEDHLYDDFEGNKFIVAEEYEKEYGEDFDEKFDQFVLEHIK